MMMVLRKLGEAIVDADLTAATEETLAVADSAVDLEANAEPSGVVTGALGVDSEANEVTSVVEVMAIGGEEKVAVADEAVVRSNYFLL
jgi:hypothetical protein